MGVHIRIRGGIIHLIYRIGDRRYEETTGLHTSTINEQNKEVLALAEVLRSKKEIELVKGFNGIDPAESRMSLYDYVAKCAVKARTAMERVLPFLDEFGGRRIKISAVTPRWYEDFQNRMISDSGLSSPHSQEKYCCFVRQCLRKAVRDGIIPRDPSSGIKHISLPDSKKEFLSAAEVKRMALTPHHAKGAMRPELQDEVRRAFLFACVTGFRISDLRQLTWECIDIEHMQIIKRQQKTGRIVVVPVLPNTLKLLGEPSENEKAFVFPFLSASRSTTNRFILAWAKEAGIKKHVTWHTARHTDATLLLESGTDLYTVMRLLGHTKIQTTMQYAVVSDKKKREAVKNLPDVL